VPELPEVETIRRQLAPLVTGRRLIAAWAFPHPKFTPALDAAGAGVDGVGRRGKYLVLALDDGRELAIHLGMTGSLRVRPPGDVGDAYVRAHWTLDAGASGASGAAGPASAAGVAGPDRAGIDDAPGGGVGVGEVLEFRDVRRFGRLAVAAPGEHAGTLALQGPDALDATLSAEAFWRSLRGSRRALKTQLLSQRPIAGVGNIYADEALWRAGLHPARRSVTRVQAAELLAAVRAVLTEGVEHGGTTLRDYRTVEGEPGRNQFRLDAYGRIGQPCRRCGTPLRRVVLDARSTTFCPVCQRR
jgi:formamidopyrimidine-DNA glycosylase